MNAKFLLLALLPVAYGGQVAFVNLSGPARTPETGPHTIWVRGGGLLYHGDAPHPLPGTPTISLKLARFINTKDGAFVEDIAEVVVTNTGQAPISIPIGADPAPLLASSEKDRRFLEFDVTVGSPARRIGSAVAASNSGHPESSATLRPGDTATFWLPAGSWPQTATPESPHEADREVRVSVQLNRKTLDRGKDWMETVGERVHSENTLLLPHAPGPEIVH